jgi:hypothetical protein
MPQPISEQAFKRLMYNAQMRYVHTEGIHLVTRPYEAGDARLYYLPGDFFVEDFFNHGVGMTTHFRTFTNLGGLDAYAALVQLPIDL